MYEPRHAPDVEICEDCRERPGRLVVDPYRYELFGERVEMVLCDDCIVMRRGEA